MKPVTRTPGLLRTGISTIVWSFYNPVTIEFGRGLCTKTQDLLPSGRGLVVSGKGTSYQIAQNILKETNPERFVFFPKAEANPSVKTTEEGIALCRREKCGYVLGIGGGSPLDCAKTIAFLANKNESVIEVLYKKSLPASKGLPFIAVPTTAGTGSEVTQYSILTDTENKKKISIANVASYPDIALIDPALTDSMPPRITASTGLDVLAHGIESAWTKTTNPVSQVFAAEAVHLVLENLEEAVKNGSAESRDNMMRASMLAGLAISGAGTTINHSISYPLTLYRGLEHGFACAISLPAVMRYNLNASRDILLEIARSCGLRTAEELIERIESLLAVLDAPRKLSELDIKENDLDWLTEESFSKNVVKNPETLEKKDMRDILRDMI